MRLNLPVTQQEHGYPEGQTLLSTTDTASYITYANAAFVRISGYSADELIGEPHNLLRHPDMPAEAFDDMWQTLKLGQSWRGIVKNRRKNGDHYWVRANATPMQRNGKLVGYLSVRTKPTSEEVQAVESLYAEVKAGRAKHLAFHRGLVVHTGMKRVVSALQLLPTAWRVRLPLMMAALGIGATLPVAGLSVTGFAMVGSATVAGMLLANWFIESQITAPLGKIADMAQQFASGEAGADLNLNRCDTMGQLARSVAQAGLILQSLVADVNEQVSGVQVASQEIATANSDLANRTEQAASSLQQTAAAMEQQTASVRQNSDTARQASQLADVATDVASKGGEVVSGVVSTMAMISDSSRKISDIIGVIDGIAFQTNILALNAAVEAARAGEQGRGFAVVASEVRSLAGRSAAAAKEIKQLITDSVVKVENGSRQVADAGVTMNEIVGGVKRVSDLITEMTSASKEQSIGISQVGHAVSQLDEMTQKNAAMVEHNSAAANIMNEKTQRLARAVSVFTVE